jgi:two-component system CheB/CheR fusion protein
MDNGASLHLYYIMQEAVLNAAKHGKASSILLTAASTANRYSLTVRDDGTGFRLTGGSQTGMGIRIMRYRARVIGATLDVKTEAGHGTQVTCTFSPGRPADISKN